MDFLYVLWVEDYGELTNKAEVREQIDMALDQAAIQVEALMNPESWGTSKIAETSQQALMGVLGGGEASRR